ncbi:subtilisin-like protein [Ganoderma leucocontextum]|nr:subtilisin-like protein [Ganoderma leucocontextum]
MWLSGYSLHLISVLALSASTLASPLVVHQGSSIPHGWSLHRRADLDARIPLKIALVQSNLNNLDAYLLDIADPTSPNYGKHWTYEEVIKTFRPSPESVKTVYSWLVDDQGVDAARVRLGQDGGALHLDVTVAEAEHILAAEYYVFRHTDGTEQVGVHQSYHLPDHVSKHVDLVWPTQHFSGAPGLVLVNNDASHCDTAVTLECLRQLYNFNYTLVARDKNSIAVGEYGEQSYKGRDLDLFFQVFSPNQVGRRPTFVSIAGGQLNDTSNDIGVIGESDMDFQLIMGLLPLQEVLLYQVGQSSESIGGRQFLYDELLGALDGAYCQEVPERNLTDCGNKPLAHVFSLSYSTSPDVNDPQIAAALARQCAEIGKLGLRGLTFVAASGDEGVAGGTTKDEQCIVNGTLQGGNPPSGGFVPQYPASCPYVTTVGATQVANGSTVRDPEVATTTFASGGGFSNVFPRPSWQDKQVADYLSQHGPAYAPGVFNRSGRAYPDVSANGHPTAVVIAGNFVVGGGTSASAPIVASLIAAVNDARIARGKGPVGWINPAMYSDQFKGVFNDVTNGSNPGCGTAGFQTASGWDPVTGLGTLNFERFLEQFLALP